MPARAWHIMATQYRCEGFFVMRRIGIFDKDPSCTDREIPTHSLLGADVSKR